MELKEDVERTLEFLENYKERMSKRLVPNLRDYSEGYYNGIIDGLRDAIFELKLILRIED